MAYQIKNWERFQHYKDRRPPWIKLYRELLDDINYHTLSPMAGKCLCLIWLLASELDGSLPSVEEVAFRIRVDKETAQAILEELVQHGFIVRISTEQVATQKTAGADCGSRHVSDKLRQKIMKRDKVCIWCGATDKLEIDHIVPISKGGESVEKNLQILCRSCNRKKRAMSPVEQVATQTKNLRSIEGETEEEGETETENKRALSSLEEGNESDSDNDKLMSPQPKGQDIGVENEQLQVLGKYRPVAEQIRKAWPDLGVQDTINVVQMGQTYLSRIPNPLEWIQEIALKRAPTDPVYISGRCTLHTWLITCMSREVNSIEAEKKRAAAEIREDEQPENLEHVYVPPLPKPTAEDIAVMRGGSRRGNE